jgi:hypothetical protein
VSAAIAPPTRPDLAALRALRSPGYSRLINSRPCQLTNGSCIYFRDCPGTMARQQVDALSHRCILAVVSWGAHRIMDNPHGGSRAFGAASFRVMDHGVNGLVRTRQAHFAVLTSSVSSR